MTRPSWKLYLELGREPICPSNTFVHLIPISNQQQVFNLSWRSVGRESSFSELCTTWPGGSRCLPGASFVYIYVAWGFPVPLACPATANCQGEPGQWRFVCELAESSHGSIGARPHYFPSWCLAQDLEKAMNSGFHAHLVTCVQQTVQTGTGRGTKGLH